MKKIISILIISLSIAALAGCGSGGGLSGVTSTGSNSGTGTGNGGTGGTGGTGGSGGGTGTGTETMSWNAPTTNTDGSLLTDLAGYKIYYGTSSGHYTGSITLTGRSSTSMSAATLGSAVPAPGTYYVVVTAYDTSGIESDYSNEVSVTL